MSWDPGEWLDEVNFHRWRFHNGPLVLLLLETIWMEYR
jgi:hypothetical protein